MWGEQDGDIWYNGALLEWQGRELHSFQAFNELDGDYMEAEYPVYFTYNADGIRTEKNTDLGNHEYILNGSQIVGEWIGGRTTLIIYLYDEAGAPIGMKIRDYTQAEGEFDEYFFEKNLQGDIVAVYNMDGEKIGSYTYDAWGNFSITLASTNTSAENDIVNTYNPYRYRGYYYDVETGLYYLQSRYYNPEWGRFINADAYVSTGQGLIGNNMFAYCNNNPVMNVDDSGTFLRKILDIVTGPKKDLKDIIYNSLTFEFGLGVGVGAEADAGVISASATVNADYFHLEKRSGDDSEWFVGQKTESVISVEGGFCTFPAGEETYYVDGHEVDYGDELVPNFDPTVSFGGSAYFLIFGVTLKVGFDLDYFFSNILT